MRVLPAVVFVIALAVFPAALTAAPITIDFENLSDGDSVTSQFLGLTFSNATVLTVGISLNEFEFPPASGDNVVFDDGEPISVVFDVPAYAFSGLFTYLAPVTITAFDASSGIIGVVNSLFASNLALSGEFGSAPNEQLAFSSLVGISSIQITGDPFGGSLTLDDFTYDTTARVPEPASLLLMGVGVVAVSVFRRRYH